MLYAAPFEGRAPKDHDYTLEIAHEIADDNDVKTTWHGLIGNGKPASEVSVRNSMVEMAGEKSWCLVLDADEVLVAERTNPKDTTLGGFIAQARDGSLAGWAFGIDIITTALKFNGNATGIHEDAYASLPIVSSRGSQPRLFRAATARYEATGRGAPMLLHGDHRRATSPIADAIIFNQRHRKSWSSYQAAYEWERQLSAKR